MMQSFNPDTLSGVASYISHEYGMTGYRITPESSTLRGDGFFTVSHFDGSEFRVMADRWGNVERMSDDAATERFFANANSV